MDRRGFLAGAAGAAGALALSPKHARAAQQAASEGPRHLVVVFLSGGNDGLNTLVPFDDDLYHAARPDVALRRDEVLRIDDHHGLHPSLAKLAERYSEGGVALLPGVGYAPPNLSHFTSRDVWDSALVDPAGARTGWIGRTVDALLGEAVEPTAMLSIGGVSAPLSMLAERNAPYAVANKNSFRVKGGMREGSASDARMRALEALNRRAVAANAERVAGSVEAAAVSIELLERALEREPAVEYPDERLARDLSIAARAIDAEMPTRVFHVAQSGYDTHVEQRGMQAALLADLDAALDAFLRDLAALGRLDRTLVLVYSEFGRRVAQNGVRDKAGTDHGAAGLAMMLGNGIRAGIHGARPSLDALDDHGNLPHTTDFRAVYADAIAGWFGLDAEAVLGGDFGRAGLVRA